MIFRGRRAPSVSKTAALADAAEAEAAEVEARATVARARAVRLRQQAETGQVGGCAAAGGRQRRRRSTSKAMSTAAVIMLLGSLFAASGYFVWQHRIASQKRLGAADFAAAARQDVAALMSLDFNKTQEDMQRIAENSTGNFKQHFPVIAQQLSQGLQRSQVVTTVTVSDVAVESMTDNSAVVLVAATTKAKEADGPQEPRTWHIALTLQRDGGQPKMSNVEFVQ
jgi:Mce-associated membrane protein